MSEAVRRIFVEKKDEFAVEAHGMLADLRENLSLGGLKGVRIINRYDVTGLSDSEYAQARGLIFSEPPVDICYEEEIEIEKDARVFAIEYLPGQYDQRADSAEECISILTQKERPTVKTAKLIVLYGTLSDSEFDAVKHYIINPVEMREASLEKPDTLALDAAVPEDVATVEGFTSMDDQALTEMIQNMALPWTRTIYSSAAIISKTWNGATLR